MTSPFTVVAHGETAARSGAGGWIASLALAAAVHAGAIGLLLGSWHDAPDTVSGAPAILVELAPITAAPSDHETDVAPGPQREDAPAHPAKTGAAPANPPQVLAAAQASDPVPEPARDAAAAEPDRKPDTPAPGPDAAQDTTARPQTPNKSSSAPATPSAPSAAQRRTPHNAAPAPGAASNDSALPSWKAALMAQLERSKRYPPEARSRGDQGVALLAFSIDRQGGVHRAHIAKSSGSPALDQETLALLERAQPLPSPPADARGTQIAIMVPIRYAIH